MAFAGAIGFGGGWDRPPDVARMLGALALGTGRQQVRGGAGWSFGRCDGAQWSAPDRPGAVPGNVALFHGRLDYRGDLLAALGLADVIPAPTDADLVAAAYGRWGEDCPAHLSGDFAVAVWDAAARRLLLARDITNLVPLVWWRGGQTVLFATEPRGLFAVPDVPKAVDEAWMARWLAVLPAADLRTPYKDVQRVPHGQALILDRDGQRLHRYWRPEELAPVRLASDADYEQRMRDLLDDAIRCRVGGDRVVATHLSGGLDSTMVTALTARQLAPQGRRVVALTAVPTEPFDLGARRERFGDEGPLAAMTAALYPNVEHVQVPNNSAPLMQVLEQAAAAAGSPPLNPYNQIWIEATAREAKARGCNVLLTAQMGNMTFSYDGMPWLMELFRRGRWLRLVREMQALHRKGHIWRHMLATVVEPTLPQGVSRAVRKAMGRPVVGFQEVTAINRDFARRVGVWDEALAMAGNATNTPLGRIDARLAVLSRIDPGLIMAGVKRQSGVDMVDPTADRRVLEFCLAIPREQFLRRGETRSLARRAMAGLVPAQVLGERRKGLQAADWAAEANRARPEFVAELARLEQSPLARECLDLPLLRRLVEDWPQGGWDSTPVIFSYQLALARGLSAGRFIRQVEGGNA